ncbi:MAG TPA: hypothetical protein VIL99_04475 [Ignavibacteria bacterium]
MAEAISKYNPNEHPQTEGTPHIDELRLLSVNGVRKILGIRYETVVQLINNGDIETVVINRKRKVPMLMLRKFINQYSINLSKKRNIIKSYDNLEIKNKIQKIIKKHRKEVN